jgi:hypothetical protein
MKKYQLIIIWLFCAIVTLSAGNSAFSYAGFPFRYYGNDIYGLGMGDTGASDVFRYNTGYGNPAVQNLSNRSLFATGILLGYNAYASQNASGEKYSYLDNSLDLPYFSLSLPLKKHRLGFQFNSFSSGVVANQRTFKIIDNEDTTEVVENQNMDRYLYRADLIYSYTWKNTSLGISANYYLGHDNRYFSQDAGVDLIVTEEELIHRYQNPGVTIGFTQKFDKFALGGDFSPASTLKGKEVRTSIHDEETVGDYEYKVPAQITASATVLPLDKIKISADLHYELWNSIDATKYTDSWKMGIGAAFEPEASEQLSFLKKLPYRGGISYRHLPFRVEDKDVNELALSLGVTLPLKSEANRIDIGLQYLNRGTLAQNKLRDNSFMLMIGFTGFDIITKAPDRTAPRDIPAQDM